jgi:hypothetical protein
MAEPRVPDQSVKIALFAKAEIDELVEIVSTARPDLRVTDGAMMSAVVLAARHLPVEVLVALVSNYWTRAKAIAAAEAIGSFLRRDASG